MNKHKTKFFKKTFEQNADDIYPEHHCGSPTQMMTEETFVPLIGQLYDQAKTRYKKRYKQKALEFAEWVKKNYYSCLGGWSAEDYISVDNIIYTTERLYEIWKEEIKK